jgi:hypothetical protein
MRRISIAVAQALGGLGWEPQVVGPIGMSRAEVERYTVRYLLEGGVELTVVARSGGVQIVHNGLIWPAGAGADLWYLDHGARSLVRSDHCNKLHVRWIVREHGVVLAGPAPASLIDPMPEEALRSEFFETLNHWGRVILDDPASYRNRFYQGFIVLNYCRMLHDLHRGYPGSKREGAEWAKSALDPSWSDLIDRAWDTRPDPGWQVRQPPDPEDFRRTLRFVAYVMDESKRYVAKGGGP